MSTKYGLVPLPACSQLELMDSTSPFSQPLPLKLTKRAAQYLEDMLARPEGISAIEYPGQRLADGIFKIRRAGLDVETLHESHQGSCPGTHARYRLRSKVVRMLSAPVHKTLNGEHQCVAATSEGAT